MNTPIQCSDNANTTTGTNHTNSTIHSLPVEVIGLSLSLLAKHGHFRYAPLACKTLRNAYSNFVSEDTITRAESVVSPISCAKQFFEDVGTDTEQLFFFWKNAAKCGRVHVMEWAYRQGYSRIWQEEGFWGFCWGTFGSNICDNAATCGQLDVLKWLKAHDWLKVHDCPDGPRISIEAAQNGHLAILQWLRMAAHGTNGLAPLQREVGILLSSNG